MVRFVPDYAYIQTDPEKKAEAEAAALTLCTVIGLPELAEGAAQGILLAWAYGEAIMDIRMLISGGKVPLVKNAEDWKLSLSGLMQLGSAGENVAADSGKDMESGLAYREYLRMLLFLKSQDEVGMRYIRYGGTKFKDTIWADIFSGRCLHQQSRISQHMQSASWDHVRFSDIFWIQLKTK